MSLIRQLLEQRGNARLRAFFEIAAESGMRASEICRLRIQDVFLDSKELFVGLPNKTMTERTAYFYLRAEQSIRDWLKVRRDDCGHDFLFHNHRGQPLQYSSIRREFKRTLSTHYDGVFSTKAVFRRSVSTACATRRRPRSRATARMLLRSCAARVGCRQSPWMGTSRSTRTARGAAFIRQLRRQRPGAAAIRRRS